MKQEKDQNNPIAVKATKVNHLLNNTTRFFLYKYIYTVYTYIYLLSDIIGKCTISNMKRLNYYDIKLDFIQFFLKKDC